jgi:hypothetical protein
MAVQVTLYSLSGTSPFDVYICQFNLTGCFYIDTITNGDIPYTFNVPAPYDTAESYCVKVVDNQGCVISGCSVVNPTPTPTNTVTPTRTSTPTPTPSVTSSVGLSMTPTQTSTPTPTYTPTVTSTQTPTPTQTPFNINNTTQFYYDYYIGAPPDISFDTVADAAAAKLVLCDMWNGPSGASAYGSLFNNPLQVGTYVEQTNIGGLPMPAGNYVVGNFTTVAGPTSVNYWVVIDGSGFVTEYTLIDPNC